MAATQEVVLFVRRGKNAQAIYAYNPRHYVILPGHALHGQNAASREQEQEHAQMETGAITAQANLQLLRHVFMVH